MKRALLTLALGLAAPAMLLSARAQNLLTTNAGFEANIASYTPGWGYPQGAPDALPGWVITLDPTGDGYAGAANNQSPQNLEGTHFGYIYSGTGSAGLLETDPAARAPVQAGATYTLWLLARSDADWSDALATVSLVWYANQNNGNEKGEAAMDLSLPARVATDDPMQPFHLSATAPQGTHYAGVRVTRPAYDYAPLMVDDFVIMAEPKQIALSIKQNGSKASLHWPRSAKFQLQELSGLSSTSHWSSVVQPPKGLGATNCLEYPLTQGVHFFRLATPN